MGSMSSDDARIFVYIGAGSTEEEETCEEEQGEQITSYDISSAFGNNKQFVSEVEWSARKILRESNQRRRNEAVLMVNKAKVKKVRDHKRRCKDLTYKNIYMEPKQVLVQKKISTLLNNQLGGDKNAAQQVASKNHGWLLPTVQKSTARYLPRPPSKHIQRVNDEVLLPSKSLEAQTTDINIPKVATERNKTPNPSYNIRQVLQNSPFFTPKMLKATDRSPQEQIGGKDRWKKRNKESIQWSDWTSQVLRMKYRSDDSCQTSSLVVAVESSGGLDDSNLSVVDDGEDKVRISPHPLEEQLRKRILQENDRARASVQRRLTSYSFATNLHESWIANVDSLREFRSEILECGLSLYDDSCGNSLFERRDSDAIRSKESQIQSISLARALRKFQLPPKGNEDISSPVEAAVKWAIIKAPGVFIRPKFFICDDSIIKWNDKTVPALTIRAADNSFILSETLCPGCTCVGEKGISWDTLAKYPLTGDGTCIAMPGMDSTQGAAFFTRAGSESSSAISVTVSMAIERPLIACHLLVLDSTVITPEVARPVHEKLPIPTIMAEYSEILKAPLQSKIDSILPPSIIILNSAADKADWTIATKSNIDGDNKGRRNEKYKAKHRREMSTVTDSGFRCKEMTEPRTIDGTIKTHVFGVSEHALTPNKAYVSQPVLFHSEEYITEENLTRRRTYADFRYVLQDPDRNKKGGSLPDTSIFIIHMKAYSDHRIERTNLRSLRNRQEEKRKKEEEDVKKEFLAAKIDAGVALFERKRRLKQRQIKAEMNGCVIVKSEDSQFLHNKQGNHLKEMQEEGKMNEVELFEDVREHDEKHLPETTMHADFFNDNLHKIEKYTGNFLRRYNQTRIIGLVDPATHIRYSVDEAQFTRPFNTLFIENVQEDLNLFLLSTELQTRDSKEQVGSDNAVESFVRSDRISFDDAMLAVKSSSTDYEALEQMLDINDLRAFDINTRDKYGNTLLLMACQQGGVSKRTCKILLRRGADINAQNHMGNTALHYLMTYNRSPVLAQYMIQRGADDSVLNLDGMTCYEGFNMKRLDED